MGHGNQGDMGHGTWDMAIGGTWAFGLQCRYGHNLVPKSCELLSTVQGTRTLVGWLVSWLVAMNTFIASEDSDYTCTSSYSVQQCR